MQIDENELGCLLEAHLQKPEKVAVYEPRVVSNMMNGVATFKATWSWWAFFGGWAFFLYRKMYVVAAVFFIASVLLSSIPFVGLIVSIGAGVSGFYFYTKKFNDDLQIAGYGTKPIEDVKKSLALLGGFNSWVVWVAVIINLLLFLGLVMVFSAGQMPQ